MWPISIVIMTSAAYRRSSEFKAEVSHEEAEKSYAVFKPRRLMAEEMRDAMLSITGELNPTLGGRPVMPPAPAYLFEKPASYAPFPWHVETDSNQYRRAVYTFRRRSTPYPFLATFDVPNGETACVRRSKSNTPLQALMTLNETISIEAAKALAQRMQKEGGPNAQTQIAFGFELCTGRKPSAQEIATLTALMKRQESRKESLDAPTVVARVLLNLDETITKE